MLIFIYIFLISVIVTAGVCSRTPKKYFQPPSSKLYRTNMSIHVFTDDIHYVAITLKNRKSRYFDRLHHALSRQNINLHHFPAINGKEIDIAEYNLSKSYAEFFTQNQKERNEGKTTKDYRGHLGCTLSHLNVIREIKGLTVIFEDDAQVNRNFKTELLTVLGCVTKYDPDWEIFVLGFSAKYADHVYCKLNDYEPVLPGGIVKLHYWFGLWGYVVRNTTVATKILNFFNPIPWHIDLGIAEQARLGKLRVYGAIPPIATHPGVLRISSWDLYQYGDPDQIKTDTNL